MTLNPTAQYIISGTHLDELIKAQARLIVASEIEKVEMIKAADVVKRFSLSSADLKRAVELGLIKEHRKAFGTAVGYKIDEVRAIWKEVK